MATQSSSTEINSDTISKMKVADLKKELKARGLSVTGTKTELMERLQSSTTTSSPSQDLISEAEILDEDEVLRGGDEDPEFDDDDLAADADAVLADEPKVKPPAAAPVALKRPASTEPTQEAQPRKRILVRKTSELATEKENGTQEKSDTKADEKSDAANGKKVIKLSSVSVKERLELRAQKFGAPLTDTAKKEARAERFKISIPSTTTSTTTTKVTILGPSEEVLKKRAERFGVNVSSVALKMEESEKLKKRKERFGLAEATSAPASTKTAPSTTTADMDEKKKQRAERFKIVI